MSSSPVIIRGTKDGLLVILGEGPWDEILHELMDRLDRTASFFKGARVNLELGEREINEDQLRQVQDLLVSHDIHPSSISANAETTKVAAQGLHLPIADPSRPDGETLRIDRESRRGTLIRRTLRSGQAIQHPGHVVVIGDVNAGAEITAGADVVVFGRLRGVVHAGATGDDDAIVCALDLSPTQLRIGNYIARPPDEHSRGTNKAEIARILDGQIVLERWK
ncbi:MAG: septum site-determining protein MinC [Chloroflexi bacterium]|nr:septum site-determining protein MinC [Chloroflexota bacterium]